jgi:hypothetical protein
MLADPMMKTLECHGREICAGWNNLRFARRSVKDVFAAVFYTNGGDVPNQNEGRIFHRGGEGASAGFISGRRKPATDFAAVLNKAQVRGRKRSDIVAAFLALMFLPTSIVRPSRCGLTV